MDLTYPNRDAAIHMKLHDLAPGGNADNRALNIIDRISADVQSASRTVQKGETISTWSRDGYTAEELAVWDWWQKSIEINEWRRLVAEWTKKNEPPAHPGFDGDHFEERPADIRYPQTTTYTGGNNPNHSVAVSTKALIHFADQLKVVTAPDGVLVQIVRKLETLKPLPGGFAKAELLRLAIVGGSDRPGLGPQTITLFTDIRVAFIRLEENLRAMARSYENDEEFNTLTGIQLQQQMSEALTLIGGLNKIQTEILV